MRGTGGQLPRAGRNKVYLLRSFGEEKPLAVTPEQATALQARLNKPMQAVDGVLYVGKDPAQPAVGDIRVKFVEVSLQAASIVGRQR